MLLKKTKIKIRELKKILCLISLLLIMVAAIRAQQTVTTQYFYDDNGRLTAIVAPSGETAVYEYDAAGNITTIRRLPAGTLNLFSFNPHEGVPGDFVTFLGSGFAPGQTTVFFNGTNAAITEITPTKIVAEVPAGATTGIVTITTSSGSVSTPEPFTIRGMKVSPASARLYFGDALGLTATVYMQTLNTSVQWSVSGINNGNSAVGTITDAGLYTAPQRTGTFTVRAALIEDPTIFSEAVIEVRDPNNLQMVFSGVSVLRGLVNGSAPVSTGVSVRKGLTLYSSTISAGVSVRRGLPNAFSATSNSVSVSKGNTFRYENPYSQGISVKFGVSPEAAGATSSVSVSNAPVVGNITPAEIKRGLTTPITITGSNLSGVANFTFINAATGEIAADISVSDIAVNSEGTTLTAELTVPVTATLNNLVVIASTPDAASQKIDTGANIIQIIQ